MNQYKVFRHPSGKVEAVKQGWSWPAFFFGWLWACVKDMWGIGMGIFIGLYLFGLIFMGIIFGPMAINIIQIISFMLCFVFGVAGNEWRQNSLVKRGFEEVATVSAISPEQAVELCMKATTE
jgi:hypothetical protein